MSLVQNSGSFPSELLPFGHGLANLTESIPRPKCGLLHIHRYMYWFHQAPVGVGVGNLLARSDRLI